MLPSWSSQGYRRPTIRSSTVSPRTVTRLTPRYAPSSTKALLSGTFVGSSGLSKVSVSSPPFTDAGSVGGVAVVSFGTSAGAVSGLPDISLVSVMAATFSTTLPATSRSRTASVAVGLV